MASVVCGVDERGSDDAVRAAINFCLAHGTDLRLVGVVADKSTDSTRATGGERVRRNKTVSFHLNLATAAARRAGVPVTTAVRVGALVEELIREGDTIAASGVFFVRTRGRLRAALAREPRRDVTYVPLGRPAGGELTAAA